MTFIAKPFLFIQHKIDTVAMYRLVLGSLAVLVGITVGAGLLGFVAYSPVEQLFAVSGAIMVALALNILLSRLVGVAANHESAVITALILFFLAIPGQSPVDNWPLFAAVAIGIASKFIITTGKQHFMNPAAFGAAALSVTGVYTFGWWIGNPVLFIPVLLLGATVVMKVRKWPMVLAFIVSGLVIFYVESLAYGMAGWSAVTTFFLSWPTLFLAFYMLTEPFTMPATKQNQVFYAGFVGVLSNTSVLASVVTMTPELALVIANLVFIPARLKQKLMLKFKGKREIAANTYEFSFVKPDGFTFKPGQYLEWMLPHDKNDSRGIRRYFTIASAPSESEVRLAVKVLPEKGSSYKTALCELDENEVLIASQLAGDFLLPADTETKLGMIAGGIGITPFRSHLKHMEISGQLFDTALLYCVNQETELAYFDEFSNMSGSIPLTVTPVVAKDEETHHEQGYVTKELLERRVPDYKERVWYISGPPPMVSAYKKMLRDAGVSSVNIKTDFFPGVA